MSRRNAKRQPGLFDSPPDTSDESSDSTFAERVAPKPMPAVARILSEPHGEKGKCRDIIRAIKALHAVEARGTPATAEERDALARFGGFGPVAKAIFPHPLTGRYKDDGFEVLGEELKALLTPAEHDSAKRTTFNAFYTSPIVIDAMHAALKQFGVLAGARILEPGAGTGRFFRPEYRFLGVELDGLTGRIARALHPDQEVRIESIADTKLPELDAAVGNVPFADIKLPHNGLKYSLHDYCFAKSVDALKPGGVKAIASGNPAVLTLAEADAELQRLGVLRRNHADEQYTSRQRLRTLPGEIIRLGGRLAELEADRATAQADETATVGGKPWKDTLLAQALNRIPEYVDEPRRFPVGTYRGLAFGIEKQPNGAADVYLEGRSIRRTMLSRDAQGPRAVTNALARLVGGYADSVTRVRQDLAIAETQLVDYEGRLGRPFAHAGYLTELGELRDRLKVALSSAAKDGEPGAAELAEEVKALRGQHTVEPPKPVKREPKRVARSEPIIVPEPVTEPEPAPEPDVVERPSFTARFTAKPKQMSLF